MQTRYIKTMLNLLALVCGLLVFSRCGVQADPLTGSTSEPSAQSLSEITTAITPSQKPTARVAAIVQTANAIQPIATPEQADTDWPHHWLHKIPCGAPCWEGITPGQTSFNEAVAILKSKPFIATMMFTPTKTMTNSDVFGWNYVDGQGRGLAEYETLTSKHTILRFSAGLPGEILLKDIIAAYGEPSHVVAIARLEGADNRPFYSLDLIYLNDGFLVATEVHLAQMQLSENMPMVGLSFFSPGLEQLHGIYPWLRDYPDAIQSWQGFKSFRFYCRSTYEPHACEAT